MSAEIVAALERMPKGRRGPKSTRLAMSLLDHGLSDDECWPWAGRRGTNGYGIAVLPGTHDRGTTAHRLVWTLLNGPVPEGCQVDHLCHIPEECNRGVICAHRACVNPGHLSAVTSRENLMRSNSPASSNAAKTHCSRDHEFTPENTYLDPRGRRTCRTCQRAHWRRYYAEAKV